MKLSFKTLDFIAEKMIICPYRTGQDLVNFFNTFGAEDIYTQNLPSRKNYAISKLTKFNDTDILKSIIEEIIDPINFTKFQDCSDLAYEMNKYLIRDGYKIVPVKILNRSLPMEMIEDLHVNIACGDCTEMQARGIEEYTSETVYKVKKMDCEIVRCQTAKNIDNEYILEQIRKSEKKINDNDFDGAITNARTLVETVISDLLIKYDINSEDFDGDLLKMYKALKSNLNLESNKDLNDTLKQILTGLNSIVSGLGGISNKLGDRHHKKYKTQKHHAKLAVNSAFTLCEFLADTYKYQQKILETKCMEK